MIVTPSNSTDEIGDSTGAIVLLVFEVLLILWILIVNFLLWIELRITFAFHIPLNFILANLILSNYVFGVTALPFEAINLGLVWHWKFGIGLCELWHGFDVVSRTAFPWFLVVLSVERWLFCYHHNWYNTRKLYEAIIGFVCVWVFVILLTFLAFMIIGRPNYILSNDGTYYTCYWSDLYRPYIIYHAITSYFFPIILALVLYLVLICCLASKSKKQVSPHDKKPVSRGTRSEWSEESLPPTPPPTHSRRASKDIPLDRVSKHDTPEKRTYNKAPTEDEDEQERPGSRFSWTEVIFNNILLQKAIKTPGAKPTLNEDLIKTLPPHRKQHYHPEMDPDFAEKLKSPQKVRHKKHTEPSHKKKLMDSNEEIEDNKDRKDKKQERNKRQNRPSEDSTGDSGIGSSEAGGRGQRGRRWTTQQRHTGDPEIPEEDANNGDYCDEDEDWDVGTAIKLNSIKWLWVLYVIYIICWLPFYAVYIHAGFCSSCTISWLTYSGVRWFGALNSAINPLVLILIVREYRQALAWILRCNDPNRLYIDDDDDDDDDDWRSQSGRN